MKIIFLDIDGVLNSRYTEETFMGTPFVSEEKILLLKEILDQTDAKIVLSSTWRKGWRLKDNGKTSGLDIWLFDALKEKLEEYKIELMSYTDDLGHRGYEISRWLKDHSNEKIENYIVMDDAPSEALEPHSKRLVQTSMSEGLTRCEVEEAIALLNETK